MTELIYAVAEQTIFVSTTVTIAGSFLGCQSSGLKKTGTDVLIEQFYVNGRSTTAAGVRRGGIRCLKT